MQTVGEQLGRNQITAFEPHAALVTVDAMGIELELEGFGSSAITRAREALSPLWAATSDGSLRNGGVEFVTNGGLGGERLHTAFTMMDNLLARVNYDASFRCSTHMHINMLDFTFNQISRFLLTYAACEPILFAFCGAHRRSSNFCVPVAESLPFHKELISRLYDDAIAVRQSGSAQVCNKYTAMNFLPLFDGGRDRPALGTVEFRGGRPLTTLAEFLQQANLLLSIKKYVRDHSTGTDDEFLTELTTHGVNNTVYSNGVNAGIDTQQVELDDALVTAWCLLKSYQSGKEAWAASAARRQRDAEAMRNMGEALASRPRSRAEWGPSPVEARSSSPERTCPYTPWTDTAYGFGQGFFNPGLMRFRGAGHAPWTHDDLPFTREQWPRLHEYLEVMMRPDLPMADIQEVIKLCLRDARSVVNMESKHALAAMMMYTMSETVTNRDTNAIVDFLVRCGYSYASGMRNFSLTRGILAQPEITGTPTGFRYEAVLDEDDWAGILSCTNTTWINDHTSVRHMPRAVKLWFRLLETKVRIKGRALLANTIERRTGLVVALQPEMAVVNVMALLNAAGLRSEHHVHREDIPKYDEIAYICELLDAKHCTVPCVRPTTTRGQFALRTVPALNYAYGQIVDNMHEGRTARISVTTERSVY